jgi:predicted enzyme related to lactoylglutathione lyase
VQLVGIDEGFLWLTLRLASSIAFYKTLMGIKSVRAVGKTVLHIEYEVSQGDAKQNKRQRESAQNVTLQLTFDEISKRLKKADVSGLHV